MRSIPPSTVQQCKNARPQCQLRFLSVKSSKCFPVAPPRKRPPLDPISIHRLEAHRRAYYKRRTFYSFAGLAFGVIGTYVTVRMIELNTPPNQMDSGKRADDPLVVLGRERKVVIQKLGEEPEQVPDVVQTGTSTVPTFPRVIDFYDDETQGQGGELAPKLVEDRLVEYQLLGLGIKTVSFLGIQVYVVGVYIAIDDIASFQEALIRKIDPVASTLVAGEKDKLKSLLLDPEKSEEVWRSVLKDTGARTLIRIVPTRNTDFGHLRDAWVRQITAKAQMPVHKDEYQDEAFGQALQKFKSLLSRGSVPKGKELLLSRDGKGRLAIWYDYKNGAQRLGQVEDERISRAVCFNYLGGKKVACPPAQKSIVEGVMEFVERPIGTVATQVVLHV
ncbi:putative altered inheritance of mitochondria protein 18, mitochondrial [Bisporella sp. PMI_857]|nr:putative altered inheritance of mitochondria protein 18, mitochondrial [Bisporella sp. PMI_857]